MDFADRLKELAARIPRQLDHIETEEATKNALVLPFIQALGYNIFDPREVVPEFTADVGTKKGEKVDFAIMNEGTPIILIECKAHRADLDKAHASQLFRYFTTTDSRIGVLTNGVRYRFFSDLEKPNRMDSKPFLETDLLNLDPRTIEELKRFSKSSFDEAEIVQTAVGLKYIRGIKRTLENEWSSPSDELIRFLAGKIHDGRLTPTIRERVAEVASVALREFVHERVNERLTSALATEDQTATAESTSDETEIEQQQEEAEVASGIVTTGDEREAFLIVKSILRETIDVTRIALRDAKSYCSVFLDNNNRKPICRFYFDTNQWYLAVFDENKQESRIPISGLDEIYKHAIHLAKIAFHYDNQ